MYEPEPATVSLSGTPVALPVGGFLQATADGEAALVAAVREAVGDARRPRTCSPGSAPSRSRCRGRSMRPKLSRDAALALKRAAPRIAVEHRDLYRRPLDMQRAGPVRAVVLDPPRAGAVEQVAALAASAVERIAYVSCNPATFARDARTLADGGFTLDWVRPVGQFRWSTHVELAASFSR